MTSSPTARLPAACLLVFAAAAHAADEPATLASARERWLRGNYDEARAQYEALAKDPKQRAAATVGLSKAHQSKGDYDAALRVVDEALKDDARDAGLLARRAELLHFRGRWDQALQAAEQALALNKDQFLARWVRAQVYRDRGDLKKADDECRWFVRTYTARSNADQDIKDPDELLLVGLAGAENARWHNLSDQFTFILTDVFADALKADKVFWPAEYQAGVLLLEKYNRREGPDALEKALAINPNAAEALAAKGQYAFQRFEFKDAEQFAERALKINPRLPEGLRLLADVHLAAGDAEAALRELEAARSVNPRDERTLGRVAACLRLLRKAGEADALAKEVEAFDPRPAVFYYELGERLEDRRRFADAEACFKRAAELRPNLPGPSNSLGLLYMRLGREQDAAGLLEKGFAADPFNVRVSNMLKVLKHLRPYETLRTEHFELRYHPKHDAALARYMGDYLERIYADLAEKFQYRPAGPILIEVFTSHEMFSGRVIALPDLHTIGACTGRMVGLASPHAQGIRKPFNWARVLRHEVVHIFNLEQTNFLVPHWLTEGLAVSNEGFPRPAVWNELLRERVPAGDLLNLDTIDLGFIRPRSPLEWQQAYCQSQLYVEYLKAKYGPEAVGGLLAAYRDGLDTAAALKKVCKVDKAEFEKGYVAFLHETVKALPGRPAPKRKTAAQLKEAHEKDPNDPDAAAALAEALLRRDRVEARKLAEAALERKKGHPLASLVLARLEREAGNVKQERALLESALDPDNPDPRVLQALGKISYDAGELDKAAEVFERGRKAEPGEPEWLAQLARVYAQTGDKEKLVAVLKEYVPTDADDFDHRKRLARLLLEAGKYAEAERYAREALEIDVRDAEVRDLLQQALKGQKKDAEAERLRALLEGPSKG
jgi:tetratricopeptide (TPR) repeat protein